MRHRNTKRICLLLIALLYAASCGKGVTVREDNPPPIRTGGVLSSIPAKYYDYQPAVSSDGTKVVFISGRESTDTELVLATYKFDWPIGNAPGEAVRLSAEPIGAERLVSMSSDGARVAVLAVSADGAEDVYLIQYADGAVTRLTEDGTEKSELTISGDGEIVAWLQKSATTNNPQAYLVASGGSEPVAITEAGVAVRELFWMDGGAGYQLGLIISDPTTGTKSIQSKAFTAIGEASGAGLTKHFQAPNLSDAAAGGDSLVAVRDVLASEGKSIVREGDFVEEGDAIPYEGPLSDETVVVSGSESFLALSTAAGESATKPTVSADGSTVFFLSQTPYRCADDPAGLTFGSTLVSAPTDMSSFTRHIARTTESGGFEAAADLCDVSEGTGQVIDNKIYDVAVARDGNAAAFRAIIVSRFNTAFDKDCGRKIGDPDIVTLEHAATSDTFTQVASNRITIADDDRGGKEPCQ